MKTCELGPHLIIWINFYPWMDMWLYYHKAWDEITAYPDILLSIYWCKEKGPLVAIFGKCVNRNGGSLQKLQQGQPLTHWGRVTHTCVVKLTIIGSDNGMSPERRQAIIRPNAGILLIGPQGTNFNEILIESHIISFKESHLKMSSGKRRPSCLGLNVLSKDKMISYKILPTHPL